MAAARKLHVGDFGAKYLLILLADRHNADTGECNPMLRLLVQESEMSHRTALAKLAWLEERGLIARDEARRPDGTRTSTHYTLTFLGESARPEGVTPPKEKGPARKGLPPEDWTPREEVIAKLEREYPHHDVRTQIDALVREWVSYCHGSGRTYAQFDHAFANSARRALERQTASPRNLRGGTGFGERRAGGAAAAMRRLLGQP